MTDVQITSAGLARYFARREAKVTALDLACPTCRQPKGASCLDRHGQPTGLVHRARYVARGIDPEVDAYVMYDDPPVRTTPVEVVAAWRAFAENHYDQDVAVTWAGRGVEHTFRGQLGRLDAHRETIGDVVFDSRRQRPVRWSALAADGK